MSKLDHPAYGEKSTKWPKPFRPHLIPSIFEKEVYYLYYADGGKVRNRRINGTREAAIAVYEAETEHEQGDK